MRQRLWVLSLLVFLAGCVASGREFPVFPIEKLRANVTNKDDVYAAFGEPIEKGSDTGFETWVYYHYVTTLFGRRDERRLTVIFNPDGSLRHYSYSAS
ncbi:MAG TPA: outer membrane protein assembly factor BamE [Candidatus Binatia bacterium]